MKYLFFLVLILLQSCNSLEGELHNFNDYYLLDENNENILFTPGSASVNLKLESEGFLILESLGHVFKFKIPKGQVLPRESGEIYLTSRQVGQSYGIYGKINTKISYGELIQDQENCSWVERYYNCNDSGECSVEYRSRNGMKDVSYQNNAHSKQVVLNLNVDESREVVAQLLGEKTFIRKVYRYESSCF